MLLRKLCPIVPMAIMLAVGNPVVAEERLLRVTGSVSLTFDGETEVYDTVEVAPPHQRKYQSSTYIENSLDDEYVVAVVGYKAATVADDLTKLIPMAKGPLVTVFVWLDAEGNQTRPPEITWEVDPAGLYTWQSNPSAEDVAARIDSFDAGPEAGHLKANLDGKVCHVSYPVVKVDADNCRQISIAVDAPMAKLY